MTKELETSAKPIRKKPGSSRTKVPRATLNVRDIINIRSVSLCGEATIRKWASGEAVSERTILRIEGAARKLGIAVNA
jgi:hypothetical protein